MKERQNDRYRLTMENKTIEEIITLATSKSSSQKTKRRY